MDSSCELNHIPSEISMGALRCLQEARDMLHPEHMALDDVDHADGSYMCNATRAVCGTPDPAD